MVQGHVRNKLHTSCFLAGFWEKVALLQLEPFCCVQRMVQRLAATQVVVSILYVLGGFCMVIELMGCMQVFPFIALITASLLHSAGALLEFSFMGAIVMAMFAVILRNGLVADENMTMFGLLSSYMVRGPITGMQD